MLISKKFFEKTFRSPNSKDAYLKACKWIANNVLNHKDLKETYWHIVKTQETEEFYEFKLELFCMLDVADLTNNFCNSCKQAHNSFYRNTQPNCFSCNMVAYKDRIKESISIKSIWRKQRVLYFINKLKN